MPLFSSFWGKSAEEEGSSGDEVVDKSAGDLSHVGLAAYEVLRKHHNHHHHELWNVTKGKVVGEMQFTPKDAFSRETHDPPEGHDDWFPKTVCEMISRTEEWCDVMSLAPPDGLFLKYFQKALMDICERKSSLGKVTIRMMFGNIVGVPVNCDKIIKQLTGHLPKDADKKVKIWVGSWRKDISWNHAKIIAVDGKYLWTGGHNFWDPHYLKNNPVLDISVEMEGGVARDAHYFANAQWGYVVKKQSTRWGRFVDKNIPDGFDVPRRARVTVSEFPHTETAEFPPYYKAKRKVLSRMNVMDRDPAYVPVITMGRYGQLLKKARPSDDAFVAMLESAQHIVRMSLQDLGPVKLPGTNRALPGLRWPTEYLDAMAKVIWEREVDIEIVLSNAASIPGGLSPVEACYGNGWSCVDVAAEIIKSIQKQFPYAEDEDLRKKVQDNLRLCYLRMPRGGKSYKDGKTVGLHSKHFIVDDTACYIGSQNMYICDLAEWGVVIDDAKVTTDLKKQYWDPMWAVCYTPDDCNVDDVMDGLKIDRTAASKFDMTKEQLKNTKEAMRANYKAPAKSAYSDDAPKDGAEDESDSDEGED